MTDDLRSARLPNVFEPQSNRVVEVPNLENVDAFFSDPVDPNEGSDLVGGNLETQSEATFDGPGTRKLAVDTLVDPDRILLQTSRMLGSAWKFNPFKGASPGSFELDTPDSTLTKEELDFVRSCKASSTSRPRDVALRHHNAIGQIELAKINKRNRKDLSITAWPEDIVELSDQDFQKEVDSFYSVPFLPTLGSGSIQPSTSNGPGMYLEVSGIVDDILSPFSETIFINLSAADFQGFCGLYGRWIPERSK